MKRVRLIIAYDGTNYCGWQVQINGITVEEVLNKALKDLLNEEIAVIGASRTDSGVHAMGNVAVFDTETRIPAEKISFALNQRLPNDIRIQKSDEVPLDWHPRYRDSTKTYEYKILNRRFPDPLQRFYTHIMYMPLDEQKMKEAAEYIVGEHDFASFCWHPRSDQPDRRSAREAQPLLLGSGLSGDPERRNHPAPDPDGSPHARRREVHDRGVQSHPRQARKRLLPRQTGADESR